jgi:hypothetical protein
MNRDEAQARLDRIEAFASELAELRRDGTVSLDEAQLHAIAEHHRRLTADLAARFDVDRGAGQRQMTLGMRIASLLGAIALCAAVYLFFYRIWGWIAGEAIWMRTAPRYTVTLAVGHRLEPWVVSIDAIDTPGTRH